jgi:hypothetical protein
VNMAEAAGSAEQLATPEELASLRRLIQEQADELAEIQEVLRNVTALCDLSDWAAESAGTGSPPAVLLSDLRRTLGCRASGWGVA